MPDKKLQHVVEQCRAVMKTGSKSFDMASRLFGPEKRDAAVLLYGWCRYCDDAIDLASQSHFSPAVLEERLDWLKMQTQAAYDGRAKDHPVFLALQYLIKRYQIPDHYPFELLEGMAMDIRKTHYRELSDLILYCYRVAGTVGLMMSHIMEVSDPRALRHASDLGIAMQLTNIARDVREDALMGRVYLPTNWLKEYGLTPRSIIDSKNQKAIARIVNRLVNEADQYYRSGDQGLQFLSLRSAWTVSVARFIYSEIGRKVVRKGTQAWDKRVWVSNFKKAVLVLQATFKMSRTIPQRIFSPWRPRLLNTVWRHA